MLRKQKRILFVLFLVVLLIVVSKTVAGPCVVNSNSITDMPKSRQIILLKKRVNPERGQQIVVARRAIGKALKTVVAVPGDTIQIDSEGNLLINSKVVEKNYAKGFSKDSEIVTKGITLGTDDYFAEGADVKNLNAKQHYTVYHRDEIRGIVLCKIWPFHE